MLDFTSFLESRDEDLWWNYLETILERNEDDIAGLQVKDGKWEGLDGSGTATFYFNVEGDDCEDVDDRNKKPGCYKVIISGSDNDPSYGVSVAFYRANSTSDVRGGFGPKVFDAVRKAIYDYIQKRNPAALNWSPVQRSSAPQPGKANTPQARQSAYEIWSVKALWPEKYVSFRENNWLRRDIYDKMFVPKGFPKVPEVLDRNSLPGDKRKALRAFREKVNHPDVQAKFSEVEDDIRQERARAQQEEHRRREEERQRQLQSFLDNPEQNPNDLKKGDQVHVDDWDALLNSTTFDYLITGYNRVYLKNLFDDGRAHGVINSIDIHRDILYAVVDMHGTDYYIALRDLKKDSEEADNARKARVSERMKQALENPSINPEGFAEGDKLIFVANGGPNDNGNGRVGVWKDLAYDSSHKLIFGTIEWKPDEGLTSYARSMPASTSNTRLDDPNVKKYTPENVEKFKKAMEDYEKSRLEEKQRAFANPQMNPLGLKEGDKVIMTTRDLPGAVAQIDSVSVSDRGLMGNLTYLPDESTSTAKEKLSNMVSLKTRAWLHHSSLSKYSPEAVQRLKVMYDAEARRADQEQQRQAQRQQDIAARGATMNTAGFSQGEAVTVTAGPLSGKHGVIENFRVRNNRTYAIMRSARGPMEVEVTLLSRYGEEEF
jgi:primosomal replication protein N